MGPDDQRSTRPVCPKGDFLAGHVFRFRRDPLHFLMDCARNYGDLVPLRFGPLPMFVLSHPAYIEEALITKNRQFMRKGRGLRSNKALLGNGLFVSEGEFYRKQRRLMQPAFQRRRIEIYSRVMVACTQEMLADWVPLKARDVYHDMINLTMNIVAKTLFDVDMTAGQSAPVSRALAATMEHFRSKSTLAFLLPPWVPTPANLRHRAAIAKLDSLIYKILATRRRQPANHDDLLAAMLLARNEDGSGMSDRQLRDEIVNLFLAGHETTAIVLAWATVCIGRHPAVSEKLTTELDRELQGQPPTYGDLPRLKYAESVILETMRLYPPVWLITREATEDSELGDTQIRKGSSILMSQWVVQRDPRFYDDPDRFNPDRWMGDLAKILPVGAYFPFSLGSRTCVGKTFGVVESVLLLATIFQSFRLELDPAHPLELWPSLTLRPRHGVVATPIARQPPAMPIVGSVA